MENQTETTPQNQQGQSRKYETPELIVHGDVADLTRNLAPGAGDAEIGLEIPISLPID